MLDEKSCVLNITCEIDELQDGVVSIDDIGELVGWNWVFVMNVEGVARLDAWQFSEKLTLEVYAFCLNFGIPEGVAYCIANMVEPSRCP